MVYKINTEEKILNLSLELLRNKGINGFSFADIADKIGIKKASIHYYFPTKNDLIKKITLKYSEEIINYLDMVKKDNEDIKRMFEGLMKLHEKEILEKGNILYISLILDKNNLEKEINEAVDLLCNKIFSWIENVLLENNFSKSKSKEISEEIFSIILGAAIFSQNKNIDTFKRIVNNKFEEILYIKKYF